jgi:FeS assembly SUF system protein
MSDPLENANELEKQVVEACRTVFDPEIPVNIYDLGLVYEVVGNEESGEVSIKMTLTSPACPVAGTLPGEVEQRVRDVQGVRDVKLELVWDPPWDKDMISDEVKLQLGIL